jgi:CBS domain-containing protein
MNTTQTAAPGSFRLSRVAHARVEDAMHPGVISCSPETPLGEVARVISTKHIHCLVVTSVEGPGAPATWGFISGLDLVAAATDAFEERTAGDIAATKPVTASTDDPLERAAQLMLDHQVEHLIVVDAEDGRPVGVLSTLDIAGVMAWGEG